MAEKQTPHYYYAVGRRKAAIATVRLFKGKGQIKIGDQSADDYFNNQTLVDVLKAPLVLTGQNNLLDISLKLTGGGKRGQADAAALAIARALQEMSESMRPSLKKAGFLTRDPRVKERKKYGLKKARKAPQFSKR